MRKKPVQLNLRFPVSIKARLKKIAKGMTMTAKLIELIEKEPLV